MLSDALDNVAQVGFRIEIIELRSSDQAVHGSGTVSTRVRSAEQVILPAEGLVVAVIED